MNTFVVSPEPDVKVIKIDVKSHRCLIFGTDGLWNMLTPEAAVATVQAAERHNEKHLIASQQTGNGVCKITFIFHFYYLWKRNIQVFSF